MSFPFALQLHLTDHQGSCQSQSGEEKLTAMFFALLPLGVNVQSLPTQVSSSFLCVSQSKHPDWSWSTRLTRFISELLKMDLRLGNFREPAACATGMETSPNCLTRVGTATISDDLSSTDDV